MVSSSHHPIRLSNLRGKTEGQISCADLLYQTLITPSYIVRLVYLLGLHVHECFRRRWADVLTNFPTFPTPHSGLPTAIDMLARTR